MCPGFDDDDLADVTVIDGDITDFTEAAEQITPVSAVVPCPGCGGPATDWGEQDWQWHNTHVPARACVVARIGRWRWCARTGWVSYRP